MVMKIKLLLKNVRKIIDIIVKITINELVLKLKLDDEKTLGINRNITNGFLIPPVKNSKRLN